MTSFQKVIKYLAVGLALFICITMLTGIVVGIKSIFENFNIIKEDDTDYNEVIKYNDEFQYLDINLNSSNLIIKTGNKFSVETFDKNIKIYKKDDKLKVVDKNKKVINRKIKDFIVTIPQNYNFKAVEINTGAGKVNADGINTNLLEMNLGAGKTVLNNINSNKSIIETGAGSVKINNSTLNVFLNLPFSYYTFEFEKGIGELKFNNGVIKNNEVIIGEGPNTIKVEGGIGSINIETLK